MNAPDRQITVTKVELAVALRKWEEDAKEEDWPARTDDARHEDNADYLMDLIEKGPCV